MSEAPENNFPARIIVTGHSLNFREGEYQIADLPPPFIGGEYIRADIANRGREDAISLDDAIVRIRERIEKEWVGFTESKDRLFEIIDEETG